MEPAPPRARGGVRGHAAAAAVSAGELAVLNRVGRGRRGDPGGELNPTGGDGARGWGLRRAGWMAV